MNSFFILFFIIIIIYLKLLTVPNLDRFPWEQPKQTSLTHPVCYKSTELLVEVNKASTGPFPEGWEVNLVS